MNSVFLPDNLAYLILTITSHILAGIFLAKPRFDKKVTAAIWAVFAVIFVALMAFEADGIYFVTLALHFGVFYITTQGKVVEKCFLFLLYVCIYTCFITLFVNLNYAVESVAFLIVTALILMAAMQGIMYKILLPAFRQVIPYVKHNWLGYYMVFFVFFMLIAVQSVFPAFATFTVKETVIFIITVIAFFINCIAIFYSMKNMMELERAKRKQVQADLLLAQVDAQAKEVETARRNRHDLRHHNSLLLEYARDGKLDSIISYLEKSLQEVDTTTPIRFCENDTVNNILRIYQTKAENKGIKMKICAAVSPQLEIDYPDLVAIVSNALENALHGVQESSVENPWIVVSFYSKDERLVFSSKNSCSKELQFEEMPENLQGIGIRSIITSADKYNGNCRFAAQDGVFECLVIMDTTVDK